jgi:hypothetical protein
MHVSQSVPWQLKIAAKLVLARIPLSYRFWKRAGLFNLGGMERPEYALSVFRRHFDAANFARKRGNFVGLELGPGDSLFSALIARTFGASRTYLVDIGPFMCPDVTFYRHMEFHLREMGLQPPSLANCSTLNDVISACSAEYLTEGLGSLRKLPSGSVDFVWSHAVLQHVRRSEFLPTLLELRRIQCSEGVGSHSVSISDILGGKLNDLRFSRRIWESSLMANSGFYTIAFDTGNSCDSSEWLVLIRNCDAWRAGRSYRPRGEEWLRNLRCSPKKNCESLALMCYSAEDAVWNQLSGRMLKSKSRFLDCAR